MAAPKKKKKVKVVKVVKVIKKIVKKKRKVCVYGLTPILVSADDARLIMVRENVWRGNGGRTILGKRHAQELLLLDIRIASLRAESPRLRTPPPPHPQTSCW